MEILLFGLFEEYTVATREQWQEIVVNFLESWIYPGTKIFENFHNKTMRNVTKFLQPSEARITEYSLLFVSSLSEHVLLISTIQRHDNILI